MTAVEPLAVLEGSCLRMNIDVGNQSRSGSQAVVLGDIANSRSCQQASRWERKSFQGRTIPTSISVAPDGQGLVVVRGRLGIRVQVLDILHPSIGHLHTDMRTWLGDIEPVPARLPAAVPGAGVLQEENPWVVAHRLPYRRRAGMTTGIDHLFSSSGSEL